ncbi:Protein-tyrosine phosphatase [Ancylostoma duodenale]|uniref:Protein-tyrosine phosphatase n=1 Tax=Ancylostoma duodenale TaxID=51022 RepID=A0A0C2H8K1_9BILA|nr:Protein-tyrosine phosphatase [Ancylostoma duodenale]
MDSFATKEGSVAMSPANRVSTRSTRKSKSRVPTPRKLIESLTGRISSKKLGDGVLEAHKEFIRESPTFFAYWKEENIPKNLKQDVVLLYDWNRVVLNESPDYYHASYVDGCTKQRGGYGVRTVTLGKAKIKVYCINGWTVEKEPPKDFIAIHEKIRSSLDAKPMMMLVCKDGCSRSGIFCLLDIEAERYRTKGRIKLAETIKSIR